MVTAPPPPRVEGGDPSSVEPLALGCCSRSGNRILHGRRESSLTAANSVARSDPSGMRMVGAEVVRGRLFPRWVLCWW